MPTQGHAIARWSDSRIGFDRSVGGSVADAIGGRWPAPWALPRTLYSRQVVDARDELLEALRQFLGDDLMRKVTFRIWFSREMRQLAEANWT